MRVRVCCVRVLLCVCAVIRQTGHGRKSDIWSVGCVVLEMATGAVPWAQFSNKVAHSLTCVCVPVCIGVPVCAEVRQCVRLCMPTCA